MIWRMEVANEIEFARYERVPEHIAQKIIEEAKAENA